MIVFGPLIALQGRKLFPWVVSGVVAFVTLFASLIICSILGAMDGNTGYWISIAVALILSFIAGYFTFKLVWIAIGLLGIIAGLSLGLLVYSITLAALHTGNVWVMAAFAISFALIGGWCSWRFSRDVVLLGTSLVGSYAFMRGLSYFFGGYPNEAELFADLKNNIPLDDMNNAFWIYLAIFLFGMITGTYY